MSEGPPFNKGDCVRVIQPYRYIKQFAERVADRDAIVERCYKRQGDSYWTVVVWFQKRGNRGRVFIEHMRHDALKTHP